ncbi:MAG TPA: hypothetical protein VK479_03875 [Micropepsaceae bacterium]|nr:hypothetical protein [Micropepsaceae bacterium]
MKTTNTMMSLLLLSAVCISPASANWFGNHVAQTDLNIGSAPNPTPADLRAIGDSKLAVAEPRSVAMQTSIMPQHEQTMSTAQLASMEGRAVSGSDGERLGYILAVDQHAGLIELQTPRGIAIAVPASLLVEKGGHVVAPTTSRADVMAMAKTQTGRTVAINIDRRQQALRG